MEGKRWICTVCGYIHNGDEAPDRCPNCGAPKSKFKPLGEEQLSADFLQKTLDESRSTTADIIVVGTGAAAFTAAITAKSLGARVLMLEKGPIVGGTTIRSGGGFWVPMNRHQREAGIKDRREDALRYMARYSYSHLYRPDHKYFGVPEDRFLLMEAYLDNASRMVEHLENEEVFETIMEINWTGQPQVDYQNHLPENKNIRGRVLYSKDEEGKLGYGYTLVSHFQKWAEEKEISMLLNFEVTKILQDETGRVNGVMTSTPNGDVAFKAKKGVIFATGGYTHNDEYILSFQRGPIYGGCSAPTCTGDFIKMGSQLGARLGNLNGAFRAQSVFENVLENPGGSNNVFYLPGDSMFMVDKYGKRVVDEKRNYNDRGMIHFVWDPVRAEWKNLLLFMVYDQRTADYWQGFPPMPLSNTEAAYIIKGQDLGDLADKIETRLTELAPHTGGFKLDPRFKENLEITKNVFNSYAETGSDHDFHRGDMEYDREWTTFPPTIPGIDWPEDMKKNYTMYPLADQGPYYAMILAASTLDTNGGPVINHHGQVLDQDNQPIAGLYGAGNCIASPTANAYWGAGSTIGPAMTYGYIAARHLMGR